MNKITKIFNNIGFYCSYNNDSFVQLSAIKSYQSLDDNSVGYFIPYLVRNIKDNVKWEIGVGEVIWKDGGLVVKRYEVSSSSNNNSKVNFTGNENEFYLFVNNSNFNSSFNNVIVKNDHFNIDNVTSIYLVDNSEKTIDAILPDSSDARNVVVDVKCLSKDHNIKIRTGDGNIFSSTNDSIRLVSDGQSWYVLNNIDSVINFGTLSLEDDNAFSSQSTPAGNDYSFQYKDGNNLVGSELYWGSGNTNKLLLGSSSETNAHTIIATSGSNTTIFNKDLQASDFIVYGSGQPYRNLFFSYDGRVGINIPSGSRPQTVFHVVNYSCSEILRLENRTTCQPAKFTIYHKPSSLNNGSTCSILNLAGRDSNNNQKDYASIHSVASDTTNGLGGIVLSVSSGSSPVSLVSGDLNNINIGYDNSKRLNINNNGNVTLSGSSLDIKSSSTTSVGTPAANILFNNSNGNVQLNYSSLSLGSGSITTNGSLAANNLSANTVTLPNVAPSSLLTLDNNRRIVPISGINISSGNITLNNISANKFLTLDNNKNIVGLYDLNDYFLTERDITWNKYSARDASVCLRQVTLISPVSTDEFSIGDQIEIDTGSSLIYRNIIDIELSNNNITAFTLDQNVTTNTVNNITVVSITKGGYLLMQKSVTGAVSDSTSNLLSIRPFTSTVFNTAQKDIDFTIYGRDILPAFKVHANKGSVTRSSGIYYSFATKDNNISPIIINSGGSGLTPIFSTANFDYNTTNNMFPAKVSSVGTNGKASYYGTYDQNGNVKEWLESTSLYGVIQQQYAAGGSYNTTSGLLRGMDSLPATGAYPDVGFRIASLTNIIDNSRISNLNFSFRNVTHTNNIADNRSFNINGANEVLNNLGVVNKNYRIGAYEITNNQYVSFLNSVATGLNDPITSGLYHPDMSGVYGGINRSTSDVLAQYSIKNNMGNKPVNFINYINSLKFINWLENGAPSSIDPINVNEIINQGAYEILLDGDRNYRVDTNRNRKYFLPSLDQWYKAAYFEYKDSVVISGSPVVTINTDTPHLVAKEKISTLSTDSTNTQKQIIANLTVSGWLVVDKIIVRDGTVRSSLSDIGFDPDVDNTDQGFSGQSSTLVPPTRTSPSGSSSSTYWNNSTSSPYPGGVAGRTSPPLPPDGDGTENEADCTDPDLIANNNVPFWCAPNGRLKGPSFY